MKPDTKATVCVANPLSYKSLTLDPATATAVTGTDQIASSSVKLGGCALSPGNTLLSMRTRGLPTRITSARARDTL